MLGNWNLLQKFAKAFIKSVPMRPPQRCVLFYIFQEIIFRRNVISFQYMPKYWGYVIDHRGDPWTMPLLHKIFAVEDD